jgi:hypothetical protein
MMSCALGQQKDKPIWVWGKLKKFSVKSMYAHLCGGEPVENNKKIWKADIPLKIKIFMWLLNKNAILTKDNMRKKNWQGDQQCKFCDQPETINHLFFDCSLARYAWSLIAWVIRADCRPANVDQFWFWCGKYMPRNKNLYMVGLAAFCWSFWLMRNSVCFENKRVRSPTEIICSTSAFLKYWAGLQDEEGKLLLETGAEALKNAALLHHPQGPDRDEPRTGTVLLQ